ncbi:GtrA family protein [bacterium]|nr:GtrA family protein [bacterium]
MTIRIKKSSIKLIKQIIKFVIVGGIATVIDWFVYYILYNHLNISPLIANIISFCVSVIYNYTASVKWVFAINKEKSKKRMFIEFMVFSIIGLLITEGLLWIFIDKLSLNEMLSKVISTGIVMVFNFITRKIFLEK